MQLIKFIGPARKIERIVLEATGGCEKLPQVALVAVIRKIAIILNAGLRDSFLLSA